MNGMSVGYVWWQYIGKESSEYFVYIQAGGSSYRSSKDHKQWIKANDPIDHKTIVFQKPINQTVVSCLSTDDGQMFVLFDDNTGIGMFQPEVPGMVTIAGEAAYYITNSRFKELTPVFETASNTAISAG